MSAGVGRKIGRAQGVMYTKRSHAVVFTCAPADGMEKLGFGIPADKNVDVWSFRPPAHGVCHESPGFLMGDASLALIVCLL